MNRRLQRPFLDLPWWWWVLAAIPAMTFVLVLGLQPVIVEEGDLRIRAVQMLEMDLGHGSWRGLRPRWTPLSGMGRLKHQLLLSLLEKGILLRRLWPYNSATRIFVHDFNLDGEIDLRHIDVIAPNIERLEVSGDFELAGDTLWWLERLEKLEEVRLIDCEPETIRELPSTLRTLVLDKPPSPYCSPQFWTGDEVERILPLLRGFANIEHVYFAAPEWPDKALVERIWRFAEDTGLHIDVGRLYRSS